MLIRPFGPRTTPGINGNKLLKRSSRLIVLIPEACLTSSESSLAVTVVDSATVSIFISSATPPSPFSFGVCWTAQRNLCAGYDRMSSGCVHRKHLAADVGAGCPRGILRDCTRGEESD